MDNTSLPSAIRDAAERLQHASETPRLDAELLAAHATGLDRMHLLAKMAELTAPESYAKMIERRAANEPVAYITGRQAFWDIELSVTPDVLIPRSDSETLIAAAQKHFADISPPTNILDLGTGSGALLLAALSLFPAARGTGIDASNAALAVAQRNAKQLDMQDRTLFTEASWKNTGWNDDLDASFDLVLCNPPYVETDADLSPMVTQHEPHAALFAGPEGLDDYSIIIPQIPDMLTATGIAIFEIGASQAIAVSALANKAGLSVTVSHDLAGKPRCIAMQR